MKQIDLPQRPGSIHRVNRNPGDLLLEFTNSSGSRHTERMWKSRSASPSTHCGCAIPSGTPARRQRSGGSRCRDRISSTMSSRVTRVLSLRALSKMTRLETFSVVRASSVARKNASRLVRLRMRGPFGVRRRGPNDVAPGRRAA